MNQIREDIHMDIKKYIDKKYNKIHNLEHDILHKCDDNTTWTDFVDYCRSGKRLAFYCDIETLQVNKQALKSKKKSQVKSYMYSHCLSFPWKGDVKTICFANGYDFLLSYTLIAEPLSYIKTKGKRRERNEYTEIELHYFNGRKFDNHFIIQDSLKKDWGCVEGNLVRAKTKDTPEEYKSIPYANPNEVLTNRIRTSTSVDGQAYLKYGYYSFYVKFVDDYPKFAMSLRKVGKMLNEMNFITKDDLKTDFDYDVFDKNNDMEYIEAREYCYEVFKQLNPKQMRYIFNDTRILCYAMLHFKEVMYGFDPNKETMTLNVMDSYINPNGKYNPLVDIQLRRNVKGLDKNNKGFHQQISEYALDSGKNLMTWFYSFYFGGACHYNDEKVGKKLYVRWGSADSNSHYPSSYCRHDLPLGNLVDWMSYDHPTEIDVHWNTDEVTAFYEVPISYFNWLLDHCPSHYMRTGIYHYLNRPNEPNSRYLTNIHLKAMKENCNVPIEKVMVTDYVVVENKPFAGKETVYNYYKVKTEAGTKTKVIYTDGTPFHIKVTQEQLPAHMIGKAKKTNAKHCVNNLYGLPAIRQAYARYITDGTGELYRIPNGHKNSERNVLFSIATTSWAWYHLWEPLQGIEPNDVDQALMYQDTDSLYMEEWLLDRILAEKPYLFDPNNLGCWDIEHRGNRFYVATHKKYCFVDDEDGLDLRFGGVPKNSFDTSLPFDDFVDQYMSVGCEIKNTRSIMTEEHKPAIYETITEVMEPYKYKERVAFEDNALYQLILTEATNTKEFKEETDINDFLYMQTPLGGITRQMIEPIEYEETEKTLFDFMDDYGRLVKKAYDYYKAEY